MIKIGTLLILFLGFNSILNAQKKKDFTSVDGIILRIPDSLSTSSQDIASYINSNFLSEENKLRAIFIWVAENIQYDIDNMYSFDQDTNEIITKTLKTRKGVCQDYAELFNDIANKVGVKSYIVSGYTKEDGLVNYNPHTWCVAMIDSSWYIFDPTWGSGSIQNLSYVKQINDDYFRMCPEKSINSHMPFDPLWQFLNYPITNQAFCKARKEHYDKKTFFNYIDSLKTFEKQSYIDRLIATIKRIESNNINSYLIYISIQQLEKKVENYYNNNIVVKYNLAQNYYKEGIYLLNSFIDYRNNQFSPDKGDSYLKQMLNNIEDSFNLSIEYLESIENPNQKTRSSMNHLNKSIEAAMINLNKQKTFLDKVLKTSKNYRKSLFYDKM